MSAAARGRGRPAKEGGRRMNIILSGPAAAALEQIQARLGPGTATEAVERALIEYERALRWQALPEKNV